MKKMISYAASFLIIVSIAAAPGSKLVEQFKSTFPNAQNVKWSDDDAGYFVSFYQNENFQKVFYKKDGEFACSWKYSDGKELPMNIIMALNKKYSDNKIIGVTELSTQNNTSYNVKLSKGKQWYSVMMLTDGTIIKVEKFNN